MMERHVVRLKVNAERALENEHSIREVFKQLQDESPTGIRYAALILDDGLSFVHIASMETANGENPMSMRSRFKMLLSEIKKRCEEGPALRELSEIDS